MYVPNWFVWLAYLLVGLAVFALTQIVSVFVFFEGTMTIGGIIYLKQKGAYAS